MNTGAGTPPRIKNVFIPKPVGNPRSPSFQSSHTQIDSIEETFARSVESMSTGDRTYYRSGDGRLALPYVGSGLWGPITGILAMTEDLSTIDGITIMHQEETPGLGSRIAEHEYLLKFIDKKPTNGLKMTQPGRATANDEIDSISGATMSSKAFIEIINTEYGVYRVSLEGGS